MKISCPSCGKTYTLPPELVDRIAKEYERRKSRSPEAFFEAVSEPTVTPIYASSNVREDGGLKRIGFLKSLIILATVLWPVGTVALWAYSFNYWTQKRFHMGGEQYCIDNQNFITRDALVTKTMLEAIAIGTVTWVLIVAFLGVLHLATRRPRRG